MMDNRERAQFYLNVRDELERLRGEIKTHGAQEGRFLYDNAAESGITWALNKANDAAGYYARRAIEEGEA